MVGMAGEMKSLTEFVVQCGSPSSLRLGDK